MIDLKLKTFLKSFVLIGFVLGLSGCPEQPIPPETPEAGMDDGESGTSTFAYDLDLPDAEVSGEDMEPMGGADEGTPDLDSTCLTCESDEDCSSGYSCITFDEEGDDRRCFKPCSDQDSSDERCGEGQSCLELEEGQEVCINDDDDSCELCYDPDGDGYGPGGFCDDGDFDCDPLNADVNPGRRSDLCDGVDNDCDDELDEDFTPSTCGEGACATESTCVEGEEIACVEPELSESDATCDGVDDDCDGNTDEDYAPTSCGAGLCIAESACVEGIEESCAPLTSEFADDVTCDGIDEDCDGSIDETFNDSCGEGVCIRSATCTGGVTDCTPREPEVGEVDSLCDNIDQDCDGEVDEGFETTQTCGLGACQVTGTCVAGAYVCEPLEATAEDDQTCDGIDEDCDGEIDEDCQTNTLSVVYNATASTADRVALDVFYQQEVSPVRLPENYQPTLAYIAITFPPGMSSNPPFVSGNSYDLGQSVIDSGKNVSNVGTPPDEPNTRRFFISALFEPAFSNFLRPQAPATDTTPERSGHLLTIYFQTNGVAAPWNFSWSSYTALAPESAMNVLELEPIAPISP